MFANYFLIALQGLKKQPVFSAIKILSLAIGLGCSILVLMHVQYSYSFDRHIPNWERTYRLVTSLTTDQRLDTVMTSDAYAPQMRLDYPQIEAIANIRPGSGNFNTGGESTANTFHWAEPGIIDIFSLDFIEGDPETALNDPNSVVLNESTAQKYFPGQDALGKTLTHDNPSVDLRVTGVYRDLPENTHIDLQMLISVATGRGLFGENFMGGNAWIGFGGTMTYLRLPSPEEGEAVDNDLVNFVERNLPDQQRTFAAISELTLSLQGLGDIYLSPRQGFGQGSNTRAQVLLGLSVFAVLILLTSCINFANLSLAEVMQRSKEIGVRKTLGAKRSNIVWQFLFESLLLTLIALLIAVPVMWFALPVYTNLTSTNFTFFSMFEGTRILWLIGFVVAAGMLSGLVPALALSRFQAASIFHGVQVRGRLGRILRPSVTVLQFALSTSLIILAVAITLQVRYLNTMNLGFNKSDLVVMDSTYTRLQAETFNYQAMVNELKQQPGVVSVAMSNVRPPSTGPINPWRLPSFAPNEFRPVYHYMVDTDFVKTMQLNLLAGRNFSEDFPTDFVNQSPGAAIPTPEEAGVRGIVITRYAVSNFGFDSPEDALGEIFLFGGGPDGEGYRYRVIGVVDDFRLSGGLEDTLRSVSVLRGTRDPQRVLLIRIDPARQEEALNNIDAVWTKYRPETPVDRTFYNQTFSDLVYEQTNGISKASIFASIITVIISGFGLYALAFFSGQRRTKEVGVRKVLGATSGSIIGLLTWDFVKPVLVACVIAWGAGYYGINVYFEQFSSRVAISPLLYLGVTVGTVIIAVLTVAAQCYRAANADPVDSLRYE